MSGDVDTETRRKFEIAFANLPWVQREVFRLHRLEGLSYAEIGYLLELSPRYVERQLAKAIYKIGKQIDGHKLSWWERWF